MWCDNNQIMIRYDKVDKTQIKQKWDWVCDHWASDWGQVSCLVELTRVLDVAQLCGGKLVSSVELTRILQVPWLRSNLLSCLYLTQCCGFEFHVDSTFMHFMCNSVTLFQAWIMPNNTAYIDKTTLPACEAIWATTARPLDLQLWHEHLCHHNSADSQKFTPNGLPTGITLSLSLKHNPICELCLAGKVHYSPFRFTGLCVKSDN